MRNVVELKINDVIKFKRNLLSWSSVFSNVAFLDSNNYKDTSGLQNTYDVLLGVGKINELKLKVEQNAFNLLEKFHEQTNDWLFGYFTYDLKNDVEKLDSNNIDRQSFPCLHFFVPEYVFAVQKGLLKISSYKSDDEINQIYRDIINIENTDELELQVKEFTPVISKEEYITNVEKLKNHIQIGDVYEINFCQEFYADKVKLDSVSLFDKLNCISPVPFASYYKVDDNYLISASPERFVKKEGTKIISQPIKGTVKRGTNKQEDKDLVSSLKSNIKERAENVMIVDLVRNDLSKIAEKNSVNVKELFGIYSFPQVHQMISTIEAEVSGISPVEIIKHLFPMGSMTGAPKIRAMELIEEYEETKRALFSGSVGYFAPNGDFDFNVVIRSLFYNEKKQVLSFQVGGAITIKSDPELEYEECLIKARAILEATKSKISYK